MEKVSEADLVKRVKAFILNNNYAGALAVVKGVDANRIKNPPILCLIGEVYMHEKQYEVAEEVFLRAYERSPKNRKILDLITSLYIEMGEYAEAEYYYKEFISVASRDLHRYILRYRLDKGKGERLSVLIDTLERLKDYEYIEEWAYELATLYEAAGEEKKCIHECDEIVLWFGHGEYVDKAIALKCKLSGEPLPKVTTVEMALDSELYDEQSERDREDAREGAMTRRAREDYRNPRPSSTEFSEIEDVHVINPDNALESAGIDTGIDTDMICKAMESIKEEDDEQSSSMSNTGLLFGAMSGSDGGRSGLKEDDLEDDPEDASEADEKLITEADAEDTSEAASEDTSEAAPEDTSEAASDDVAQSQKLMSEIFSVPGMDKVKDLSRPKMPDFLKKDSTSVVQDPIDELEAMLAALPESDLTENDLDADDLDEDDLDADDLNESNLDENDLDEDDLNENDLNENDLNENAIEEAHEDAEAEDFQMFGNPAYVREDASDTTASEAGGSAAGPSGIGASDTTASEAGGSAAGPSGIRASDTTPAYEAEDEDDGIEVEEALESMTEDQDEVLLEQALFGGLPSGDMLEDDLDAEDEYMDDEQVHVQISEADEQFLADLFSPDGPDETDEDEVMDEDVAIPQTVKNIFATVPDVKNVHQQLAMTLTKFETAGADYDVLAPYDINFVVLSSDKGMKSQIAIGIAKALNTYGICDKNKIVRAKAAELNRQDFSMIFEKISGGCLIIERADELSDASVALIENVVNQENQDVAIVLESRQEDLKRFWKKHQELRGKFLNVINVSKYNEMELVTLAKGYIEKRGYELTPEAAIVLRDYFKKHSRENEVTGYEHVMAVVDEGIANLDKRNMKNLFMTVLDNKYEEADMLKLLPEDFKGVF